MGAVVANAAIDSIPPTAKWVSKCLICGATFSDFGRFLPVLVNFGQFLGPIFPFFSFFALSDTVYSRREPDPVL
jgi:hypothetical protein